MGKERSLLKTIIVNFWNSLKPRSFWGNQVGADYNGTQYYEIPLTKSSSRQRPPRWFVPRERNNFEQEIPPEWEAWLRYRRNNPPTEEEVAMNRAKMFATKQKAAELEKEHPKALQIPESTRRVTSKNFPIYDDLEGMPGGSIKGNRT